MAVVRCAVLSAKIDPTARMTVVSNATRKTRIFVPPLGHSEKTMAGFSDDYERKARFIKRLSVAILRRDVSGTIPVRGRIHVEKGIHRLIRPFGDRDAMPRRPDLDLVQVLLDERVAQI